MVMKSLTKAMEMKAEMLISLGAHHRAEYNQTGMHMSEDVKASLREYRDHKGVMGG
jgi:hypothetical protein